MSILQIILLAVGVIIVFFVVATLIGMGRFNKKAKKADPIKLAELIREKADQGNASFTSRINQKPWINLNEKMNFPLASTTQMIIAIEYAKQADAGLVNPKEKIAVDELNRFYIPKTDGNAHETWLTNLRHPKEVTLEEVVKGMFVNSSNANTDYLIGRLTLDKINQTLNELELDFHDKIVPLTPQLYVPVKLMEEGLTRAEAFDKIEAMSREEYVLYSVEIFNEWMIEAPSEKIKRDIYSLMTMLFQKLWTEKLTRSNSRDYAKLMGKINRGTLKPESMFRFLRPIIENDATLQPEILRYVQKGGSTAYIVTVVSYSETKSNHIELVYMLSNLNTIEQTQIRHMVEKFQIEFMTKPEFRREVKCILTE